MTRLVQDTVSAICYQIVRQHDLPQEAVANLAEVERFVFGQLERMPKLMGAAVMAATAAFGASALLHGLRLFHRQSADRRAMHWMRWKCSALAPWRCVMDQLPKFSGARATHQQATAFTE